MFLEPYSTPISSQRNRSVQQNQSLIMTKRNNSPMKSQPITPSLKQQQLSEIKQNSIDEKKIERKSELKILLKITNALKQNQDTPKNDQYQENLNESQQKTPGKQITKTFQTFVKSQHMKKSSSFRILAQQANFSADSNPSVGQTAAQKCQLFRRNSVLLNEQSKDMNKILNKEVLFLISERTLIEMLKFIKTDNHFKQQLQFQSTVKDIQVFSYLYSKFLIYCIEKSCDIEKTEKWVSKSEFSQLKISHQVHNTVTSQVLDKILEQFRLGQKQLTSYTFGIFQESDKLKIMKNISQYSEKLIINQNILFELGGKQEAQQIFSTIMMFIQDQYGKVEKETYDIMQMTFISLLSIPENASKSDIQSVLLSVQNLIINKFTIQFYSEIYGFSQELIVTNEDLFFVKITIFKVLKQRKLEINFILKIIERLESLRYLYFYQLYGINDPTYYELERQLLLTVKKQKPFLKYFVKANKETILNFFKTLIETCLGTTTTQNFVKIVEKKFLSQGKNIDMTFIVILELLFKNALNKYDVSTQGLLKDICYQFLRIKKFLHFVNDFQDIFYKITDIIQNLCLWIKSMIQLSQIPQELVGKVLQLEFLEFFLPVAISKLDVFSIHDIPLAIQYFQISKQLFNFWMKGLKRVMLKQKINKQNGEEFIAFCFKIWEDQQVSFNSIKNKLNHQNSFVNNESLYNSEQNNNSISNILSLNISYNNNDEQIIENYQQQQNIIQF